MPSAFARTAPAPESGSPSPVARYEDRLQRLLAETARLKGYLGGRDTALEDLERRPSLETCLAFGGAAEALGAAWGRLREAHLTVAAAADAWPDRRRQAEGGAEQAGRGQGAALEHALAVLRRCGELPRSQDLLPILPEGQEELAPGVEVRGGLMLLRDPEPERGLGPHGGLRLARRVAAALRESPEVLLVRIHGAPPGGGREATLCVARARATPTIGPSPALPGPAGGPRCVVVVPAEGSLVDGPALHRFTALGLLPVGAAVAGAPPRQLSVALAVVSAEPLSEPEIRRQRLDLWAFARPGPDARPDRPNVFEATGGGVAIALTRLQRGLGSPATPDLP